MCDPIDVEHDDISEDNSQNYFAIGLVGDKENIEIFPSTNSADEKFEVGSETAYGGQNIEFIISGSGLFSDLHLYWLENVMNFAGPSQRILCPEFLCFNQMHFISITLS